MRMMVSHEISAAILMNAFVGAFEGGSNYWLQRADLISSEFKPADPKLVWWGDEKLFSGDFTFRARYDDPAKDEGNGKGKREVTQNDVQIGLHVMACKYAAHFADLITEKDDAITHDVMMQCIILGDVVYG